MDEFGRHSLLQRLITTSEKHSAVVEVLGSLTDDDSAERFMLVMQRFIDLTDELVSIGIQMNNSDTRLVNMHRSMNMATPPLDHYITEYGVDIVTFNQVLRMRIDMLDIINRRAEALFPDPTEDTGFSWDDDDDSF